jgi:hypothetical protein
LSILPQGACGKGLEGCYSKESHEPAVVERHTLRDPGRVLRVQ